MVGYPPSDLPCMAFHWKAAGGSVKVPLSLLERIILEGELQWTEGAGRTVCQFTFLTFAIWLCPLYIPLPMQPNPSPTHDLHMLSALLPKRRDGLSKQDVENREKQWRDLKVLALLQKKFAINGFGVAIFYITRWKLTGMFCLFLCCCCVFFLTHSFLTFLIALFIFYFFLHLL